MTTNETVTWFGGLMQRRLDENGGKTGWRGDSLPMLLARVMRHVGKVGYAMTHPHREPAVMACVDAANFLMMIADNFQHVVDEQEPEINPCRHSPHYEKNLEGEG